ncbi:unnamed protein product [Rotaria sp. Silwood2]|nr:unnamed protein product [Rotaria sp. Silwood2]
MWHGRKHHSTTSQSKRKFPLNYVLSRFDQTLELAAEDPSSKDFGPRCRKKQQLVKTMRDDVVNTYGIDSYPTAFQFDRVIVSVKNKYPALRKIFGENMNLLTSALKQQFSRNRQLSSYLSEVLVKKHQSYGHQMSDRKLKFVMVELVSCRVSIDLLVYLLIFCLLGIFSREKEQSEESLKQLRQRAESMRILIKTINYDYG